jgi:hypothetical protein
VLSLEREREREGGREGEEEEGGNRKETRDISLKKDRAPFAVAIMYVCMTLCLQCHTYVCWYACAHLCVATLREKSGRRAF